MYVYKHVQNYYITKEDKFVDLMGGPEKYFNNGFISSWCHFKSEEAADFWVKNHGRFIPKNQKPYRFFEVKTEEKEESIKEKALRIFHNAINKGEMIRPPTCSVPNCTGTWICGHHFDYKLPLEVIWLCSGCHYLVHSDLYDGLTEEKIIEKKIVDLVVGELIKTKLKRLRI